MPQEKVGDGMRKVLNLPFPVSCYKNAVNIQRLGEEVTSLKFHF